jgi:hypothetical protein
MSCINQPYELILATTDDKLYDISSNKWLWDGDMYWYIDCLYSKQYNISEYIVPDISKEKYLKLDNSPTNWNFCLSKNCNNNTNSNSFLIIFTFNPKSKDPNDYLQYVINSDEEITFAPTHDIKDNKGDSFYLDIIDISRLFRENYIEIWIIKSLINNKLTYQELPFLDFLQKKSKYSYWNYILVFFLVIFIIIFIIFLFLIFNKYYKQSPEPINIYS